MTKKLLELFKTLKVKMSSDCNDINMNTIKAIISKIVKHLNHICNASFKTGVFPNKMKIAKVLLISKTGDKGVFSNYRSIYLSS